MKISGCKKIAISTFFIFSIFFILSNTTIASNGITPGTGTPGTIGGNTSTTSPSKFENPIAFNTVEGLLGNVLKTVQGIVAVLAVLMIVIGGIIYITSAGDQGRVDLAKKAITAAVIGLALAIAAPTFLQEIYGVLGSTGASTPSIAQGNKSLSNIILDTLNILLSILGVLAILMLVVGGIMYMTSGGDDTRTDTAKNTIKYAIIGLIVALVSLVVVVQISNVLT